MKNIYLLLTILLFSSGLYAQKLNAPSETLIRSQLTQGNKAIANPDFKITRDFVDERNQIRTLHAIQKHEGIFVREGILTITYNANGNKVTNDEFVRNAFNSASPKISNEQAVFKSLQFHNFKVPQNLELKEDKKQTDQHLVYSRGEVAASDIQARLMYIAFKNEKAMRLTWETQIHTRDRQHYWVSYVDANTGQILESEDYVISCQFGEGVVYDNSPEEEKVLQEQRAKMYLESAEKWDATMGPESNEKAHSHHSGCAHNRAAAAVVAPMNSYQVLDLPAEAYNDNTTTNTQTFVVTDGDSLASPNGWTSDEPGGGLTEYGYTRGNNVFAFHDPSPAPLGGAPQPGTAAQATSTTPGSGPSEFHYPFDLTTEPELDSNRSAAIVNLFYWNNIVHDIFYKQGFTEAGLNFQNNNFGRGGAGNDDILAQAQDGGGTNNANFLTLADGVNGQMQMYLWTAGGTDSTVQVLTIVPTSNTVQDGEKFVGLQGALYNTAMPPPTVDIFNNPVTADYILVNAGCGSSEGCGAGGGVGLAPCNNVTGKIVLIDRGSCSFVEKVDGAQKGGAAGVIIMNNDVGAPNSVAAMGGTDPTINTITIPAVMCSYNTGLKLKAVLASGATLNGQLKNDNPPIPKKDGDFDNGIIAHEYGHGISTRTSPQSATGGTLSGDEQGGEGWADYYALFLTTSKSDLAAPTVEHPNGVLPSHGIGTYVTYDVFEGAGIRPRRYSVDMAINEYTFAGSTNGGVGITNPQITVPHGVGFIWCTMLWELTQAMIDEYGFYDAAGDEIENRKYNPIVTGNLVDDIALLDSTQAGNLLALKLIQQGIALQSSSPPMTEMRDGIIRADSLYYGGYHSCIIWEAFAKRGLGSNTINPTNNIGDESDGYGVPAACNPMQLYYRIDKTAPSSADNKSVVEYDIVVTNVSTTGTSASNVVVTDQLPAGMTFLNATGAAFTLGAGNEVIFTIASLDADSSISLTVEAEVELATATSRIAAYNFDPNDAQGWTVVPGGSNTFTLVNDSAQAYSGGTCFFTPNMGAGSSAPTHLMSPVLDVSLLNRQLRFWHHYDTDSGYDGGYIEYTLDNGVTWTRMPLQTNPYTGDLNSTFNPTGAGAAFTGSIANYFESAGLIPDGAQQVRFTFSEDTGGGGGDGWWIDDVKIVRNPVSIDNSVSVTDPVGSGGRTHTSVASTLIFNTICDEINLLYGPGQIIADGTKVSVRDSIVIEGAPMNDVIIEANSHVEFRAGHEILIKKSFTSKNGATLLLEIEDCDED